MQRYGRNFMNAALLASSSASMVGSSSSSTLLSSSNATCWSNAQVRFQATKPKKPRNPYKILGVKPSASVQELKKAHRVLARKFHPDVPGGSHEKFQEIQDAYEQVKTGVWIRKGGESSGDRESGDVEKPQNRYANFRFTSGGNRRKQSYEEAFSNLHKNRDAKADDDLDEEEMAANSKRKGAPMFGPDSPLFQAWSRLIIVWSCAFVVCRIVLFLTFPPKYEKAHKKKIMNERLQRKPPPPKPLVANTPVLN